MCLTGTDEWFGVGRRHGRATPTTPRAWPPSGTPPTTSRSATSSAARKLWVAKINGLCHAGGLDLALHCDVTVASDRARFRVPELLRGIPDPFMSARLVDVVGLARARYLFFTAAEIDAAAAAAMGLVGEVVPHDELDARTEWILEQIRSTGPVARATVKRDLNAQLRPGDVSLFMVPGLSAEIAEGMGAFVEKRAAAWPRP